MRKIFSVILCTVFCVSLCSCSDKREENKNEVYENFREYIAENTLEENYYIQISKTASESHILTEASKLNDDCAFMHYDVNGNLKFYRDGKYTALSISNLYIPEEKDAKWEDFEYESMAASYREIIAQLCSNKDDSSKNTVKDINVSDSDNKEFPDKYSVQYDLETVDTRSLFQNGGNFGSLSIKFLSDENGINYKDISLNCQYDYNDEIYVISVKYGTPDSPDEKGENGQRPEDIEEIFQDYVDKLTSAYTSSDFNYEDYLDQYMNQ